MNEQTVRARAFRDLHDRAGAFVIPNPWDAGSAKLLARLGFAALATTSAGLAYALGRPDGAATRDETLANARAIVDATDLPVSADLENGFGADPAHCAETIRLAAAVQAARALPFPFVLTARAENLIHGRPDFPDTIRRLEAFAAAGADVLFAPGLETREEISAVVRAVAPKPVNVIMGLGDGALSLADLAALGVRRVSVGSSLARAAYGAFLRAAEEIHGSGTFAYARAAVPYAEMNAKLRT